MSTRKNKQDGIQQHQIQQVTPEEMQKIDGGALPHQLFATPTWKYVDGTPAWAIQNAINIGYTVENIS